MAVQTEGALVIYLSINFLGSEPLSLVWYGSCCVHSIHVNLYEHIGLYVREYNLHITPHHSTSGQAMPCNVVTCVMSCHVIYTHANMEDVHILRYKGLEK